MGTEVLRPQDWFAERFQVSHPSFHHHQNVQNNHLNYGKRLHQQEVTNPNRIPSYNDFKVVSKITQNNRNQNDEFSRPKVTILRRGESMDFLNEMIKNRREHANMVPHGLQRLGPQIPEIMYAGSAFSSSPPPSDLPLPTFFKKHQSFDESYDDSATRDLRRLLRIE